MKKALSVLLLFPSFCFAASSDSLEAWYAQPVTAFTNSGYLRSDESFRPSDKATRAEFVTLVVQLLGGAKHAPFIDQSFDDVKRDSSSFPFFEEAGIAGWMNGIGDCYRIHPCLAKPDSPINRAEAAALLSRAYNLDQVESFPFFEDNEEGQWFTKNIRNAAGHCILRGDGGTGKVRPEGFLNRAEMVVMLDRLNRRLSYPHCDAEGQSYSLPKAPPASTASQSSMNTWYACTAKDWECYANFGDLCLSGEYKNLNCTLTNDNCINPEVARPRSIPCSNDELLARMKSHINEWDILHEKILAKAKELTRQQNGSHCIATLSDIESRFIAEFNDYLSISRALSPAPVDDDDWQRWMDDRMKLQTSGIDPQWQAETIENTVKGIEKEYEKAPSICF